MKTSKEFIKTLLDGDPFKTILGKEDIKKQIKSAMIADHHIIIIGPPGVGKTTIARSVAEILPEIEVNDCPYNCLPEEPICPTCIKGNSKGKKKVSGKSRFVRIQGSPELTVEDIIGDIDPVKALEFGPSSIKSFTPGKIFKANNGILFFDELNRCPEKLQNAMLQVLEEGKATLGNYDIELPANFIFIGTMNPEDSSTEKLSDVFLDRFDVVYMGYPESLDIEKKIVVEKGKNLDINFPENLLNFMIDFIRALRSSDKLEKHPSVRASLYLYERAQSNAYIKNRTEVKIDDIKEAVISVLSHRISFKPSFKYLQDPSEFLEERFDQISQEHSSIEKGGDP